MRAKNLHTVCESARCPNLPECWSKKTATFMILGDTCTRSCGFCAIKVGRGLQLDPHEPENVAKVANDLGLKHVVVTSVARDDMADDPRPNPGPIVPHPKKSKVPLIKALFIYQSC